MRLAARAGFWAPVARAPSRVARPGAPRRAPRVSDGLTLRRARLGATSRSERLAERDGAFAHAAARVAIARIARGRPLPRRARPRGLAIAPARSPRAPASRPRCAGARGATRGTRRAGGARGAHRTRAILCPEAARHANRGAPRSPARGVVASAAPRSKSRGGGARGGGNGPLRVPMFVPRRERALGAAAARGASVCAPRRMGLHGPRGASAPAGTRIVKIAFGRAAAPRAGKAVACAAFQTK